MGSVVPGYVDACEQPNDAKATSLTYTLNHAITSLQSKLRQGFNQEGQRDLEGIYLWEPCDLHGDGLEHLSNDETSPHLCKHDDLLATPDQMQSQFPGDAESRLIQYPTCEHKAEQSQPVAKQLDCRHW